MLEHKSNYGAVLERRNGAASPAAATMKSGNNHLLTALTPEESERLAPSLEHCVLEPGQLLFAAGQPIERVYFLHSGLASFMAGDGDTGSEAHVEVGLMGCETAVADISVLNGGAAFLRVIAQVRGAASWLPAQEFREECRRGGVLQAGVLGSLRLLMAQSAQSALCNKLHTTEERLSRWLLLTYNRIGSDQILIRQEFLAHVLGTRHSGVAVALGVLQQAGLIFYSHENVTLLDRPALAQCSCECYPIIAREYQAYADMMSRLHELSH